MIFVSSSCAMESDVCKAVDKMASSGFLNIELSGGGAYYDGLIDDLIALKKKYSLNYICHNYFPPDKDGLVVNIASLNDKIRKDSIAFLKRALDACVKLGSERFGFHAGYFTDIDKSELGKTISKKTGMDKKESIDRFCSGYAELQKHANNSKIDLYIENNVYSFENFKIYGTNVPMMLVTHDDFVKLSKLIDFKLLLDIGHLKVSAETLGLDHATQLKMLSSFSDYIHVSDNDGLSDQHRALKQPISIPLKDKTITLEICDGMQNVKEAYRICERMAVK